MPTEGAALGSEGVVDVGTAAHITAAAPGGPRYDATLTPAERKDESNGIWCCAIHGRQIDSDPKHFTVEMLRQWKREAEEASARAILALQRMPSLTAAEDLDEVDRAQVRQLGLPLQDDVAAVLSKLRAAARADIAAFKGALNTPSYVVALNLTLYDRGDTSSFTVAGLASAITTFNQITLVAPPGTGKTTTMLQGVEAVLDRDGLVAVFVPLSEWATQTEALLPSITRRAAFSAAREEHFKLVAIHGRCVLVLDGWNELDAAARKRLRNELSALVRDYPELCILMSTRRQALDVGLSGPTVEIDALSQEQQLSIARALRGSAGESILDHAWRTAGIRELVGIPLYLTTVLAHTEGDRLPTTREEVFRLFIAEHEGAAEKAEALYAATYGFHAQLLEAVAVEATRSGNVTISDARTRGAIKAAEDQLVAGGQLSEAPQPVSVLQALISHHVLVRAGTGSGGVAFQHQQFQEFYAAAEVERLMHASADGDQIARARLRKEVLNEHAWEESILFACERASRTDEAGTRAVACAIREALTIDPMLAAEMIYRSSPELWDGTKNDVSSYVTRWHTPGQIDRALGFMINTGRGEFSPLVWPLVSNPDDQIHFRALRAGRRFRVSVLGAEAERNVGRLTEKVRQNVLSEIASNGGFDGIEFATKVAVSDTSPTVQAAVVEYLLFRRAERQAERVLKTAPDEVWHLLAEKGFDARDVSDPELAGRLELERRRYDEADSNLTRRLRAAVLAGRRGEDTSSLVQAVIENSDLPFKEQDSGSVIHEAHELYPSAVHAALIHRLERNLEIPFRARDLLIGSGLAIDSGPIVDLVLSPGADRRAAAAAASVVGAQTIGRLIDELLTVAKQVDTSRNQVDKALSDEFWRLRDLVANSNAEAFGQAILNRASIVDADDIARLAGLVDRQGSEPESPALNFRPEMRAQLVAIIMNWAETLLAFPGVRRSHLAEMARAITRLPAPELLPALEKMLAEDLKRWRSAREEAGAAHAVGKPIQNDAHMSWTLQYRRAFVSIGNSRVIDAMKAYLPERGSGSFGVDAALVLFEIWERDNRPLREGHGTYSHEFAQVRSRRQARQSGDREQVSALSETIFAAVDDLTRPGSDDASQLHALRLAKVAFCMPYGDKASTIDRLLGLPQPLSAKRDLLTALVLAGEVVSADLVLEGIRVLLEEAKSKPWLVDPQQGQLDYWLVLLPFSDRPKAALEALQMLSANLRDPRQLDRLLAALGNAPGREAEEVLDVLACEDATFLDHYELFGALEKRHTASSMRLLLGMLAQGRLEHARGRDDWHLARDLASAIGADPSFRSEVYGCFQQLAPSRGRNILERAILEAPDAEAVLLLVRDHAKHGRSFDGALYLALEQVAIHRQPSSQWIGAHELLGEPVPELRKQLFAFVKEGTPEAEVARACLNAIDELRDEHGPAEAESRHPDIESGLPWPLLNS